MRRTLPAVWLGIALLLLLGDSPASPAPPATGPIATSNPVYIGDFADPYCWYENGVYYAVGTGRPPGPRKRGFAIPMLKSTDLQHWESVGAVLKVPDDERGGQFWAPEAAVRDGVHYLYYAADGNGHGFHIRVATSDRPTGPYTDAGKPVTDLSKTSGFAIDPTVFHDDGGKWYLFYARDFYDSDDKTFRGTALEMDELKSMTELAGHPAVVMRAHWQWQVYQRNRNMGGKVADWFTLEGPEVIKRNGKYYCFYSGGNYQNDTYGENYLTADKIEGPWSEAGEYRGPQVLRTVMGKVTGPGHCSILAGPDGRDYIVYHAWDLKMTARQMWVDPIEWKDDQPVVARFQERISEANKIAEQTAGSKK
jgi:beta-xylosidase